MQRSLRKKLFLAGIGCFVFGALLLGNAIHAKATQPMPPSQAQCSKNTSQKGRFDYFCAGEKPGAPPDFYQAASLSPDGSDGPSNPRSVDCAKVCGDAGGVSLTWKDQLSTASADDFCFGATDQEKTCKVVIKNASGDPVDELIFVATGMPAPPSCASNITGVVCQLNNLWNGLASLPLKLVTGIFGIIADVVGFIFSVVTGLLNWITQYAMSIPVSPSASGIPQTVQTGWQISRDIIDLLFILVLAFIGLATILRLQNYQLQKILPAFIAIALLVNFSGVLVGFVVDTGNIITNFFLQKTSALHAGWDFTGPSVSSASKMVEKISADIGRIIFYLIASVIYFVIFLLFFVRIFVLWTLSILAPIAFAAYILPATKKYWNQWFQQLIQWSIVGIPISFFMYLARLTLERGATFGTNANPGIIAAFMGPFTALFLLFVGVSLSMQMAPAGARGVIDWGKKAGTGLGKFAGRQTLGRAMATKTGATIAKNAMKANLGILSREELGTRWKSAGLLGKAGLVIRTATSPTLLGARWGIQQAGKQALQYGAQEPQVIDKRTSELEKKFGKDYEAAAATYPTLGALDYEGKIATALYLTKTKGGKGLSKLSDKQKREATKLTARYNSSKLEDVVKHAPEMVDDGEIGTLVQNTLIPDGTSKDIRGKYKDEQVRAIAETGITDTKELLRRAAKKKAVEAMKTTDIENADPALMDDQEFREIVARWRPWAFIQKIGEEWGSAMVLRLQDEAEKIGLDKIAKTNSSFINGPYSAAGRIYAREWNNPNGGVMNQNQAKQFIKDQRGAPQPEQTQAQTVTTPLEPLPKIEQSMPVDLIRGLEEANRISRKINDQVANFKTLGQGLEEYQKKLDGLSEEFSSIAKDINELNQKARQGAAELSAAEAQRKQTLETTHRQLEEEMKSHGEAMAKLKEIISAHGEDILRSKEELKNTMDSLEPIYREWEAKTQAEAETKATEQTFRNLRKNIKNTGKK